jgi:hypothetical protein
VCPLIHHDAPRMRFYRLRFAVTAPVLVLVACPLAELSSAQSSDESPARDALGGPDGVQGSTTRFGGDERLFDVESQLEWTRPYFDFKRRLRDEHGLSFSLSAHLLFQEASETLSGRTSGAGNILRFQGTWEAFGRGTGHEGRLNWRLEERRSIGGSRSPFSLGEDAGTTALNPANGYSDAFDAGF